MNLKLANLCMMQYAIPYRRPYPSYIFQTPLFALPTPLSFLYIPNSTVHSHNTRQRHEPHVQARRSMVATNSLTHKAHGIWSATPHQIKELDTRSKFKRSLKREMLTKYKLHRCVNYPRRLLGPV